MSTDYYHNLLAEWSIYKNRHGCTQTQVSKQLGWAPATLGLYLSGKESSLPLTDYNSQICLIVTFTGFFPDLLFQVREYPIAFTASGNPAPQQTKKMRRHRASQAVYCDVDVWIEGAALAIPAGTTLVVQPPELIKNDPLWPTMSKRYWLVESKKRGTPRSFCPPKNPN